MFAYPFCSERSGSFLVSVHGRGAPHSRTHHKQHTHIHKKTRAASIELNLLSLWLLLLLLLLLPLLFASIVFDFVVVHLQMRGRCSRRCCCYYYWYCCCVCCRSCSCLQHTPSWMVSKGRIHLLSRSRWSIRWISNQTNLNHQRKQQQWYTTIEQYHSFSYLVNQVSQAIELFAPFQSYLYRRQSIDALIQGLKDGVFRPCQQVKADVGPRESTQITIHWMSLFC